MKSADFDVVVIGSGFGGSVAALRLSEKGYKVAVLEAGRRFSDKDFPKTSWRLSRGVRKMPPPTPTIPDNNPIVPPMNNAGIHFAAKCLFDSFRSKANLKAATKSTAPNARRYVSGEI